MGERHPDTSCRRPSDLQPLGAPLRAADRLLSERQPDPPPDGPVGDLHALARPLAVRPLVPAPLARIAILRAVPERLGGARGSARARRRGTDVLRVDPVPPLGAVAHLRFWTGRLLGWGRWESSVAAVISPLLFSITGRGFEDQAFTWLGSGLWSELWAMWTVPLAIGFCWRFISRRQYLFGAVFFSAATIGFHFLMAYLIALVLAVLVLLRPSDLMRRLGRCAIVGGVLAAGLAVGDPPAPRRREVDRAQRVPDRHHDRQLLRRAEDPRLARHGADLRLRPLPDRHDPRRRRTRRLHRQVARRRAGEAAPRHVGAQPAPVLRTSNDELRHRPAARATRTCSSSATSRGSTCRVSSSPASAWCGSSQQAVPAARSTPTRAATTCSSTVGSPRGERGPRRSSCSSRVLAPAWSPGRELQREQRQPGSATSRPSTRRKAHRSTRCSRSPARGRRPRLCRDAEQLGVQLQGRRRAGLHLHGELARRRHRASRCARSRS